MFIIINYKTTIDVNEFIRNNFENCIIHEYSETIIIEKHL